MSLNAASLNPKQVRYQGSIETGFKPGSQPSGAASADAVVRSKETENGDEQSPASHMFPVKSSMHEFGDSTFGSNEQIDLKSGKLGEIHKQTLRAINEHKDLITQEYKVLKRHLDLERGNKRSEIRLARKEKRSRKHVEQLEKSEYSMKKDHMNQLHETLMKHHFSLSNVEEECMKVFREESIEYISLLNKQEVTIWKRTCQDLHDTLELPVKGFTLKSKCRLIDDISEELREILSDGISQLTHLLANSSLLVDDGSRSTKFKAIQHLIDLERHLNEYLNNKKKVLVKGWHGFGEAVREDLNKYTQLLKFQHKHRLSTIADICTTRLKDVQESGAKRHGKLMQKIAREQELLDKERAEMKAKHGERKVKSKNSHNNNVSSKPSVQGPFNMPGGGMPSYPGMGGMAGFGGMPGGYPGMGGMNFNMSNAVDLPSSAPTSSTELHSADENHSNHHENHLPSVCHQLNYQSHGDVLITHHDNGKLKLLPDSVRGNPEPGTFLLAREPVKELLGEPATPPILFPYIHPTLLTAVWPEVSSPQPPPPQSQNQPLHQPPHHPPPQPTPQQPPQSGCQLAPQPQHKPPSQLPHQPALQPLYQPIPQPLQPAPEPSPQPPHQPPSEDTAPYRKGACVTPVREDQLSKTPAYAHQLSKGTLKSLRSMSKKEQIHKYLQTHVQFQLSGGVEESPDHEVPSVSYSFLSSNLNRNVNAESSESDESSDDESDSESGTSSKSGSLASRLMGRIRGSKSVKSKSETTTSGSTRKTRSKRASIAKDENIIQGAVLRQDKPNDYQDFVANDHDMAKKKKWSPFKLCSCCTLDNFVAYFCPCFKSRYQDFKEKRAEQKERKQMQRQVLLRLRNEKANRED